MSAIILDIETIAQPEADIRAKLPPFSPDKVALGNRTKPDTIAAYIEECRAKHGDDIVAHAALDPRYGQVAIVGMLISNRVTQYSLNEDSESYMLNGLWSDLSYVPESEIQATAPIIGFNVHNFDLYFCVVRSLILGVPVPLSIWNPRNRYPFTDRVIDLMEVLSFGDYSRRYSSCDEALRMFGIKTNPHGKGSEFGEMWRTDKAKALAYNAYDLESERELAGKLGVI